MVVCCARRLLWLYQLLCLVTGEGRGAERGTEGKEAEGGREAELPRDN